MRTTHPTKIPVVEDMHGEVTADPTFSISIFLYQSRTHYLPHTEINVLVVYIGKNGFILLDHT